MDQIIGLTKDLKCITQLSQFKQMQTWKYKPEQRTIPRIDFVHVQE